MRIALIGTGKTGAAVDRLAESHGHTVVTRFTSQYPLLDASIQDLNQAEIAIDFSRPDLAIPHIERYCSWGIRSIIGTTGWYDELARVEQCVEKSDSGVLYAANFSIGVAIAAHLAEAAAKLVDVLPEFDASIHETHHRLKLDSPSGTALHLANLVLNQIQRKKAIETETQHQKINPDALHVTSARTGYVFGKHDIILDGPFDAITITHEAKGRDGFASGALRAAEWLRGRRGLYTIDDCIRDWIS